MSIFPNYYNSYSAQMEMSNRSVAVQNNKGWFHFVLFSFRDNVHLLYFLKELPSAGFSSRLLKREGQRGGQLHLNANDPVIQALINKSKYTVKHSFHIKSNMYKNNFM